MFNVKTSNLDQQSLLRYALQQTGDSRIEFAKRLNITKRALDSWMVPNDSKGFRTMSHTLKNEVVRHISEARMMAQRDVTEATISDQIPAVRCDKLDFIFPTLYRQTVLVSGIDPITGLPDPSGDYQAAGYSLAENISFHFATNAQKIIKAEPIRCLSTTKDSGWIRISEHRTLERADAHIRAVIEAMLAPEFKVRCSLYKFKGRIFTLVHHDKPREPSAKDTLTIYLSDSYLEMALFQLAPGKTVEHIRDNEWRLILDADGKELGEAYDWGDQ